MIRPTAQTRFHYAPTADTMSHHSVAGAKPEKPGKQAAMCRAASTHEKPSRNTVKRTLCSSLIWYGGRDGDTPAVADQGSRLCNRLLIPPRPLKTPVSHVFNHFLAGVNTLLTPLHPQKRFQVESHVVLAQIMRNTCLAVASMWMCLTWDSTRWSRLHLFLFCCFNDRLSGTDDSRFSDAAVTHTNYAVGGDFAGCQLWMCSWPQHSRPIPEGLQTLTRLCVWDIQHTRTNKCILYSDRYIHE